MQDALGACELHDPLGSVVPKVVCPDFLLHHVGGYASV